MYPNKLKKNPNIIATTGKLVLKHMKIDPAIWSFNGDKVANARTDLGTIFVDLNHSYRPIRRQSTNFCFNHSNNIHY